MKYPLKLKSFYPTQGKIPNETTEEFDARVTKWLKEENPNIYHVIVPRKTEVSGLAFIYNDAFKEEKQEEVKS